MDLLIRTKGSPAFAVELEKRLGVDQGEVKSMHDGTEPGVPQVYLAHAVLKIMKRSQGRLPNA